MDHRAQGMLFGDRGEQLLRAGRGRRRRRRRSRPRRPSSSSSARSSWAPAASAPLRLTRSRWRAPWASTRWRAIRAPRPPVPPVIRTVRSGSSAAGSACASSLRCRPGAGHQRLALAQGELGLLGIGGEGALPAPPRRPRCRRCRSGRSGRGARTGPSGPGPRARRRRGRATRPRPWRRRPAVRSARRASPARSSARSSWIAPARSRRRARARGARPASPCSDSAESSIAGLRRLGSVEASALPGEAVERARLPAAACSWAAVDRAQATTEPTLSTGAAGSSASGEAEAILVLRGDPHPQRGGAGRVQRHAAPGEGQRQLAAVALGGRQADAVQRPRRAAPGGSPKRSASGAAPRAATTSA